MFGRIEEFRWGPKTQTKKKSVCVSKMGLALWTHSRRRGSRKPRDFNATLSSALFRGDVESRPGKNENAEANTNSNLELRRSTSGQGRSPGGPRWECTEWTDFTFTQQSRPKNSRGVSGTPHFLAFFFLGFSSLSLSLSLSSSSSSLSSSSVWSLLSILLLLFAFLLLLSWLLSVMFPLLLPRLLLVMLLFPAFCLR